MNSPLSYLRLTRGRALARSLRRDAHPVHAHRLVVRGPMKVQSCDFHHRLEIRNTVFMDLVDVRDVCFWRTVDLRGCIFLGGLVMDGVRVQGSLLMDDVIIGEPGPNTQGAVARMGLLQVRGDLIARGLVCLGDMDLARAEIRGRLDLSSTREHGMTPTGTPVVQERITFIAGNLRLSAAAVAGNALLSGIHVAGGISAECLRVGGKFSIGPLRADQEREAGDVIYGSYIGEHLYLPVLRVIGELNLGCIAVGGSVNLQTADIRGGLFCRCKFGHQPLIGGDFLAPGARIHGALDLSGALFLRSVYLEGLALFGSLFLHDGWKADEGGVTTLAGASARPDLRPLICGTASFANARVEGSAQLPGIRVHGDIRFDGVTFTGRVDLSQAWIDGNLNLRAATIHGGVACGCGGGSTPRIGGSILARGARIDSGITLSGADVGGDADFAGARISGTVSLNADGAALPGQAARAEAKLCRLGGTLHLSDAVIAGSLQGFGLVVQGGMKLARVEVKGSVEMKDASVWRLPAGETDPLPAPAQPSVRLAIDAVGARVGGALRLAGARTAGAVNLQNSRILGGLFCGMAASENDREVVSTVIGGEVMLDGAEILMLADFWGATIHGELSLERARVNGKLHCGIFRRSGAPPMQQSLDIRNARIRHLDLDWSSSDECGGLGAVPVQLDGCVFHELSVPENNYVGIFASGTSGSFRQGGYLAVERWLRVQGDDDAAEKVYNRMRRFRRRTLKPLRRPADILVGTIRKLALHYPTLIMLSLAGFLFSIAVFRDPASSIPGKAVIAADHDPNDAASRDPAPAALAATAVAVPAGPAASDSSAWSVADAVLISLRLHLPMLSLPGRDQWEPAPRTIPFFPLLRYDFYATIVSVLSYIFIPLIIGGTVTTWLQRRSVRA